MVVSRAFFCLLILSSLLSCQKEDEQITNQPQVHFSVAFEENLPRLGNFGEAANIPPGHAAQSPMMQEVSIHNIELAPDSLTPLSLGAVLYRGPETSSGGANAVDFDQALKIKEGETFLKVDLSQLAPGTYEWLRVSLTYQNYLIDYRLNFPPFISNQDFTGNLASFVGFNTYITSHTIQDSTLFLNANKLQGYWAFETNVQAAGINYGQVNQGDGAGVTVVNPISQSSPVPAGSCVVTGKLKEPLVITGQETEDIAIVLAFSINHSFEWKEVIPDGKFEPAAGETVVDMGLRGLHPYVQD